MIGPATGIGPGIPLRSMPNPACRTAGSCAYGLPVVSPHREVPTAPSRLQRWFPIGAWLPGYPWGRWFGADLLAAVSVAALLIPESMGLATVAGVPPEIGLYAAPAALIAYAMLGGSRLLVVAVAGSVAAVSAGVVGDLAGGDPDKAIVLTAALAVTTGVVFVVAGLIHLGWITNFMSRAVMAGFIIGLSIQIIIGQLGDLLGIEQDGDSAVATLVSTIEQVADWNWTTLALGLGALLGIIVVQRFVPRVPAALVAVFAGSVVVAVFEPDVALVAEIPDGLPPFSVPTDIDTTTWAKLLLGGCAVALVGLSEGYGAAKGLAGQTHDDLDTNRGLRAIGASNIGAGLSGGMVVTGSLGKSMSAASAGARSQMSSILLAVIVLGTLAFLAPAFQWLPAAVLSAIVINAMLESARPRKLIAIWRIDHVDFVLGSATLVVLVFVDLLPAMIMGVALSIIYTVYRISFPARELLGRMPDTGDFVAKRWTFGHRSGEVNPEAAFVPGVMVYRFSAPLIFSNASAFVDTGQALLIEAGAAGDLPHTLVIDCEEMYRMDATGVAAVKALLAYAQRYGVVMVLARVHTETRQVLHLSGAIDEIGDERLYSTVRGAVDAVDDSLNGDPGT